MVIQYIKFSCLIVLFLFKTFYEVHAQPLSNLDFLANLTDSLLEGVSKEVSNEFLNQVKIKSLDTNKDIAWFIENEIFNVLKGTNISSIYLNRQQDQIDSTKYTVFEFKVLTLGIEYVTKNEGDSAVAGNVKRKGKVGLTLRLFNHPGGELLWSGIVEGTRSDWIPNDRIRQMENQSLPFTRGVFLNGDGRSKFLEPILITGVTGVIIFLFYSLRSR